MLTSTQNFTLAKGEEKHCMPGRKGKGRAEEQKICLEKEFYESTVTWILPNYWRAAIWSGIASSQNWVSQHSFAKPPWWFDD